MADQLQSTAPFERFVALAVVELSQAGETPAHSYEVTETAKDRLGEIDQDGFGGIERGEVIGALNALAEADLLAKATTESAVGKGRPAYELAVDTGTLLERLGEDPTVGGYATVLRD